MRSTAEPQPQFLYFFFYEFLILCPPAKGLFFFLISRNSLDVRIINHLLHVLQICRPGCFCNLFLLCWVSFAIKCLGFYVVKYVCLFFIIAFAFSVLPWSRESSKTRFVCVFMHVCLYIFATFLNTFLNLKNLNTVLY